MADLFKLCTRERYPKGGNAYTWVKNCGCPWCRQRWGGLRTWKIQKRIARQRLKRLWRKQVQHDE